MKTLAVLAFVAALTGSARADETIFTNVHSGVYVAPQIGVGSLKGSVAALGGGRIAWLADNTFAIGLGGSGIITRNAVQTTGDTTDYAMLGYGGLVLEYTPGAEHLIHPAFSVLVGGGMAGSYNHSPMMNDWHYFDTTTVAPARFRHEGSPLFVVEPSASLEVNLATFLRLDLTASYRYLSNFTQPGFVRSDVSGLTGNLGLKIGWF